MLPIGAYAYSQGLEFAVEAGWVGDEAQARSWLTGLLEHNLAHVDVPVLARLYEAWGRDDPAAIQYWSTYLLASREGGELVDEDRHLGRALARLLDELGVEQAAPWMQESAATFATLFALAARHWDIPLYEAAHGYLWSWCENQVAAAMKLIPLGQSAGQRLLTAAMPAIERAAERGLALEDEDIGAAAPGLALASARHETQYTRLFRS